MLTSDLVKVRFKKKEIFLPFINPTDLENQKIAQTLINIFQNHLGNSQNELTEILKEVYTTSPQNLFYRGLAKLLLDRCEFEVKSALHPSEIREAVFLESAKQKQEQKKMPLREQVLAAVSQQLTIDITELEEGLYADLKEQQRLIEFKPISDKMLLARYNLALVQAVLFKATSLKVQLPDLSPLRKRQLFRYIKFYQLLYTIQNHSPFEIALDGPMSLFSSCQKYGFQMAMFLPVILHNTSWHIEAQLLWGKQRYPKVLILDHTTNLKTHYQDLGQYIPPEILEFKERFNTKYEDWKVEIADKIVELGTSDISIPDFKFIHQKTKKTLYLEIFGYWRKSALLAKWEKIKEYMGNQLIIAVQKNLQIDEEESSSMEHIYVFRSVLIPREIYKVLNNR